MAKRIITPEAILSYPHLFTPQEDDKGQLKYSASLVFLDGADLKEMKNEAVEAARAKWGTKADSMIRSGSLRMPFRKDGEEKGYPEGAVFVNVRSGQRPGIVSRYPDPKTGKPAIITDEEEIYPGVIVRASVTAFAYDVSGNKGVSFALNNIQKLRDGERLDGRMKAEDEFEADEELAADLEDLTDGAPTDDLDGEDEGEDEAEEVPEAPKKRQRAASKPAKSADPLDDLI